MNYLSKMLHSGAGFFLRFASECFDFTSIFKGKKKKLMGDSALFKIDVDIKLLEK